MYCSFVEVLHDFIDLHTFRTNLLYTSLTTDGLTFSFKSSRWCYSISEREEASCSSEGYALFVDKPKRPANAYALFLGIRSKELKEEADKELKEKADKSVSASRCQANLATFVKHRWICWLLSLTLASLDVGVSPMN